MGNQPDGPVVGVDSGGTFTDAVVLTDDGDLLFDKAPTTTDDLSQGTVHALQNIAENRSFSLSEVLDSLSRFAHGTTVATNALIERTGCRVGLLTTEGFEDTTVVMRDGLGKSMGVPYQQAMDYLHNERPNPLPPKDLIEGVPERVDDEGEVLSPLNEEKTRDAVATLLEKDIDAIAINLLWSFKNPSHEKQVANIIEQMASDVFVTRSSQISPVLGEYERAMTTVINAYLGPIMNDYIERVDSLLTKHGLSRELLFMQCTGGLIPASTARRSAVSMINSGPVGGLVAAQMFGERAGTENIIATDVGGTSFDVGVIKEGEFTLDRTPFVDQGIPVHVPAVEISTIGAGGGSIIWTQGNRLRVGPKSAGSQPGPVCYNRGGTEPTVTDALLILGYLNPNNFFGGRMDLDIEGAEQALARVGEQLGMNASKVARGAYEIVTAKMADLLRKETVEKGYDPRGFTLYSYGGAGPAHAAIYGRELGVEQVIVPRAAPVFSAFGIAFADTQRTYSQTNTTALQDAASSAITTTLSSLEDRAEQDIGELGEDAENFVFSYGVDMRYVGQMSELTVSCNRSPDIEKLEEQFHSLYEQRYGHGAALRDAPVEATTFRLTAIKPGTELPEPSVEKSNDSGPRSRMDTREMHFPDSGQVTGDIYDGADLAVSDRVEGPAIIEQSGTTIVVPPEFVADVNERGNIRINW